MIKKLKTIKNQILESDGQPFNWLKIKKIQIFVLQWDNKIFYINNNLINM